MESTNALKMVNEHGWRTGFVSLFHDAERGWFRSRTWLVQGVI